MNPIYETNDEDNQTIMSDITDNNTTVSSDILLKYDELSAKTENELNKLNIDGLKEKCKEYKLTGISKMKKPELVQTIMSEYNKLVSLLKDKKTIELKTICKSLSIKCLTNKRKDDIVIQILSYCSSSLNFKIDDPLSPIINEVIDEPKLSPIEELEKQRQEIESKMKEELEKQQKLEEETKIIAMEEEKRLLEEQRKKEKEELKKKKQSIPKQVRTIVWNHYIGEDIIKHKCLCCKKVTINNTNFDVGHVLSEKNGGTHEINNLRPICGACNHSMGTENMIDFVVKYGLYIG